MEKTPTEGRRDRAISYTSDGKKGNVFFFIRFPPVPGSVH
jgi:hypothetical protein